MANFNKVILMGNVTKNPDVRQLPNSDTKVAKFGIAVNRKFKDKEETLFIDVTAFGGLAEHVVAKYVVKGKPLLVEGRLKFSQWEQDGQNRSKHEVVAENVQLLGGGKGDSNSNASGEGGLTDKEDVPF